MRQILPAKDARRRAQAHRIGERFRRQGVAVGVVFSSQWCRTRETAELAFPGQPREKAAFTSFFEGRSREPAQSAAARALPLDWQGPAALVVVMDQVNITALSPVSGAGVVLRRVGAGLEVVGRILF